MIEYHLKGSGGGGGKGGGGDARTPVESPDSLRSIQYANVLDLISEGEIGGLINGLKSVYLDDTPLQNEDGTYNFSGVVVSERYGTQSQSYIDGFATSEAEIPVGVEIKNSQSVTRTISNPNNTHARVTVSLPSLTFQNLTNGDLTGTSVEFAIDVQSNGGGFVAQPIRQIFSSTFIQISGGVLKNTLASTKFKVTTKWTPSTLNAPQSIEYQLQYKLQSEEESDWKIYATSKQSGSYQNSSTGAFGGVSGLTPNPITNQIGGAAPANGFSLTDRYLAANKLVYDSTKTFEVTLAEGLYDFRVVKITGTESRKNPSALHQIFPTSPVTGINAGGSVAIVSGESYAPAYTEVISGKTTTKYQRSYKLKLEGDAPWDIRLRRITADSSQNNLQNKTFWDSYTEIVDEKLSYPNSALVGIRIDAKQFNNIPTRGYEISGIKVKIPSNYDPVTRAYDGTWDGTWDVAVTDNPAWIFYDLVTNSRYGLGDFISEDQIDKWSLYTIAQYCDVMVDDGFGGIEPRFTCNIYYQEREEAYKFLANLASIFRGIVYWSGSQLIASQDSPRDVEQLFTRANVIEGKFNYTGSSGKVRHSVVLVTWNDPQDGYRQKIEYVQDEEAIARYGVVQTEIVALGCTSRGQARRIGNWLIYSEQNETETISFRASIDAVYVTPGSIIKVQDPSRSGVRRGGRIVSATSNTVTLDSEVTLISGNSYTLYVRLPDGSVQERALNTPLGTTNVLTVLSDFDTTPEGYAIWILESTDLAVETWRVISIAESNKTEYEIIALAYDERKYQAVENDLVLQPLPLTFLNAAQPNPPTVLSVTEALYQAGLGVIAVSATLSWDDVIGAVNYIVSYKGDDENEVFIDNIKKNTVDIRPIQEGIYEFSVYTVNSLGRRSIAKTISYQVLGKTVPPVDVENFQMVALSGYAHLTWNPTTDLDVAVGGHMRIRYSALTSGAEWANSSDIGTEISGTTTNTTLPLLTGTYLAKWIDSGGRESENAVLITSTLSSIVTLNVFETIVENPTFSGVKTNLIVDSGSLRLDDGELSGEYFFTDYFDLGSVQTSRLMLNMETLGVDNADQIDSRPENVDSWNNFDGQVIDDVSAKVFVRTTNDSPDPSDAPDWSEWQPFFVGDWTARAFEFKVELQSAVDTHNILVSTLEVVIDMPDRDEYGSDIVSGTTTYSVTYPKSFMVTPSLSITAQNMATGDYYVISNKDEFGFDILFKNSAGTNVSRTFDYLAKGY